MIGFVVYAGAPAVVVRSDHRELIRMGWGVKGQGWQGLLGAGMACGCGADGVGWDGFRSRLSPRRFVTDSRFVCSQRRRAVGHCPLPLPIAHCPRPLPIVLLCHVQQPNSNAKSAALYALRPRDSIGRGQGQRTTRWVFRPPPSIQYFSIQQ